MKTVKTPKGTDLPLVNLKGKDYLMVAHRLIWLNEEVASFRIETNILRLGDEGATVQAKVTLFTPEGREFKSVMATKSETKKDFPDFLEKAETGSIGRAVALAGFGTQFAIADLDEGDRLADAPLVNTKDLKKVDPTKVTAGLSKPENTKVTNSAASSNNAGTGTVTAAKLKEEMDGATPDLITSPAPQVKVSTFRKNKPAAQVEAAPANGAGNGWE